MTTLIPEKCSVCSTLIQNCEKWSPMKLPSARSPNTKRKSTGQTAKSCSTKQLVQCCDCDCIKQLQNKIQHLEVDCQYLRVQLRKNSAIVERSNQQENELADLKRACAQLSLENEQLSVGKNDLTIELSELKRKYENVKQFNDILQDEKQRSEHESRAIRDQTRTLSEDFNIVQAKLRALEQQFERQLNENKSLHNQLNHFKKESNNLQRNLNDYQIVVHERDRLQCLVNDWEKKFIVIQDELKLSDVRCKEVHYLRSKLADENGILQQEIIRLETLTRQFERNLEEVRRALNERTDAFNLKDKELNELRKKERIFRSTVDDLQKQYEIERIKNQELNEQIKQLQKHLNIEIQNSSSVKREINEFEERNMRLQEEINLLKHDNEQLKNETSILKQRLIEEKDLATQLRINLRELENSVAECDRFKSIADLVQSQRWDEMSQMAQTMQSVSNKMARATSPTFIRKRPVD